MNASSPIRGGLIGCGFVSQHHLAAWTTVPGARLVALCDLDAARLDEASRRAPGAALYRDAEAMLTSEGLDFVEICTLPESHRRLVALAAARGVHVLCQKPASVERPDLAAMLESCARGGVRLMI